MASKGRIQSVDRMVDILEYLYQCGGEAGIKEISTATGIQNSTVCRQLSTLKARGYIYQNKQNTKYRLGIRFYALGNMAIKNLPLADVLQPYTTELAQKYNQTVYVTIPDDSSAICAYQSVIYKQNCSSVLPKNDICVGMVIPCHGSATGKCLMANYPQALLDQYAAYPLAPLTKNTIVDWTAFRGVLSEIRSQGYAIECDEEEEGFSCIAVPIYDSLANIVAAISLSGQTRVIMQNNIEDMVRDLRETASHVSSKL